EQLPSQRGELAVNQSAGQADGRAHCDHRIGRRAQVLREILIENAFVRLRSARENAAQLCRPNRIRYTHRSRDAVGPERCKRLRSIFQAVLGPPEPLRARYLDEVCGDDGSLRADVDSLLAANAQAGGDLDRLPELETAPARAEPEDDDARIGERVGAYAL